MLKTRDFHAADALVYLGEALGAVLSWFVYDQISPVWLLWALCPLSEMLSLGIFEGVRSAMAWRVDEAQGRRVFSWGLMLSLLMLSLWSVLGFALSSAKAPALAAHALPLGICMGLWGLLRLLRAQARLSRPVAVVTADALLGLMLTLLPKASHMLGGALGSELWLAALALLADCGIVYLTSEQPAFMRPDKDSLNYLVREGVAALPRRMAFLLPVGVLIALIAATGCFGWQVTPSLLPVLLITALWRLGCTEQKLSPSDYERRCGRLALVFGITVALLGALEIPSVLLALWAYLTLLAAGRPSGVTVGRAALSLPMLPMAALAFVKMPLGYRALAELALLSLQLFLARGMLYAAWLPFNAARLRRRAQHWQ